MSYEDKGFQAYNLYLSIRAHFHGGTGKNYDITKQILDLVNKNIK